MPAWGKVGFVLHMTWLAGLLECGVSFLLVIQAGGLLACGVIVSHVTEAVGWLACGGELEL